MRVAVAILLDLAVAGIAVVLGMAAAGNVASAQPSTSWPSTPTWPPPTWDSAQPQYSMGPVWLKDTTVCTLGETFERGPSYRGLSCRAYYAALLNATEAGTRHLYYWVCWALDPCGAPK